MDTTIGGIDMTINAILMLDILFSFRLSYMGERSSICYCIIALTIFFNIARR